MFDPYRKWLGIPPKDQPPNHYRLLSLELYESDLDVIEGAADRAMGFVRQYQSGEHAELAAKVLNEIANARLCLLKPKSKSEYDTELKKELAGTGVIEDEAPSFEYDEDVEELVREAKPLPKHKKKSKKELEFNYLAIGGIGAGGLVLLIVIVALAGSRPRSTSQSADSSAPAPASSPSQVATTYTPTTSPTAPKTTPAPAHVEPSHPDKAKEPTESPKEMMASTMTNAPTDMKPADTTMKDSEASQPDSDAPEDGELFLVINIKSGRCLSVKGENVVQGPTPNRADTTEHWRIVASNNSFRIVNESSHHALTSPHSTKPQGKQLVHHKDSKENDQRWRFVEVGKYYAIESRSSGLNVGLSTSSKDSNKIVQLAFDNSPDRIWRLKRLNPKPKKN